jgi:ATP-dependent exoDNAse (exonuclease V) alpha subunit
MISGREALSSLQNALAGARRDEDRLVAMLNSASEEAGRLRASQAEAYRALARIRLDEISRDDVSQKLDSVERAALELLDKRKASLERAAETRRALMARIDEAQAIRADAVARLEIALEAVDDQRERTQARLESDEAWVAQRRALSHAKDVARGAAEKAERSEAEKAEKTRPYEADRLFVYLWKRGLGTPAYRRSGLVRYFDGRIARLIGYDEARPNYFMLN